MDLIDALFLYIGSIIIVLIISIIIVIKLYLES